jgi:hypothetical protein
LRQRAQVETFGNLDLLIVNVREHLTKIAHVEPLPDISCNDWRPFYEALIPSELNQRKYCEACGIPLNAFGNWRAKFKAEPRPTARRSSIGAAASAGH